MKEVRVAIIGFGGIARSHANGYKILAGKGAPVKLVALCDIDEKRFTENVVINLDTGESRIPADYKTYTDTDNHNYTTQLHTEKHEPQKDSK